MVPIVSDANDPKRTFRCVRGDVPSPASFRTLLHSLKFPSAGRLKLLKEQGILTPPPVLIPDEVIE